MEYNHKEIEQRWQEYWAEKKTFASLTPTLSNGKGAEKPKYYVLDMFPYPSGSGLHVGHPLGYIASDIYARYKRAQGFNVLHPMGYDSFGLPAEQYAIQTGQHPAITTEQNIKRYREQLDKLGFSFDWEREVKTSDPKYYKWTQWIFLQLFNSWYNPRNNKAESIETLVAIFENEGLKGNLHDILTGDIEKDLPAFTAEEWKNFDDKKRSDVLMHFRLAYLGEAYVNWCPALGTVLANDEVKDGVSERGGYPVERKLMKQWSMRITAYAERLLQGLETIDWSESIKEAQRNWIGKSEGCSIRFSVVSNNQSLTPNPSPKERGMFPGYHTAKKEIWEQLKFNSKANRQNQTEAESILWERVRNNNLGHKIRRQHAVDQFIADFICLEKKLIIEIDGDYHNEIEQKEYDDGRTFMLEEIGYRLIRFTNAETVNKTDWVCEQIKSALNAPLSFGEGAGGEATSPLSPWKETGGEASIEVFTTRPDTIFGVTFLTLAPEHELVSKITTHEYKEQIEAYLNYAKNRSERDRQADVKKITGQFTGAYAIHPFTGKQIPVWVGDYVLAGYGTGAVMAVPGSDQRDFNFAKHFGLPIIDVVVPLDDSFSFGKGRGEAKEANESKEGKMINSDFLNGLQVKEAIKKIIAEIEKRGLGRGKINYRLRDAAFGRQRYWGEPIPIYYKDGIPYGVDEKDLPVVLPEVDKFLPTEDGEPPLARAKDWTYTPHPQPFPKGEGSREATTSSTPNDSLSFGKGRGEAYPLESTTMPGWAGSSWYYLRYMDPHNEKEFVSKAAADYWKNVDFYLGGSEHATGHLLYVRFWTKFLKDRGFISIEEPAKKLVNQGMIQGETKLCGVVFRYKLPTLSEIMNSEEIIEIDEKQLAVPEEELEMLLFPLNIDIELPKLSKGREERIPIEYARFVNGEYFLFNEDLEKLKKDYPKYRSARLATTEEYVNIKLMDYYPELVKASDWPLNLKAKKEQIEKTISEKFFNDRVLLKIEIEKMSKSKWNVVNPDELIEKYGADTLRMYEMFLGPLEQSKPWNTNGITGVSGFLKKFWKLYSPLSLGEGQGGEATKTELKVLHKTIKKITDDIEKLSFNTCVSTFMICVNELTDLKCNKKEILEPLVVLIAPFAPHIAEELWKNFGHTESVTFAKWPEYKEEYTVENSFSYPVSFNGKTRFFHELDLALSKEDVEKKVMALEQTKKYLDGKQPKKVIVVPKKIVNIVV